MQPHRAVHSGDQRHLDVENVHEDFPALAIDLVVALWGKEVEAFRADGLHERVAAARQDDNAIITVRPDRIKQVDKLFVGMPIENQRAAIRCEVPLPARLFLNEPGEHSESYRDRCRSNSWISSLENRRPRSGLMANVTKASAIQ